MSGYRLFFHRLSVLLPVGLHPFEQAAPQRIDLDLVLHLRDPGEEREGLFDYDRVRDFVKGLAAGGQIPLQEELCQRIIAFCREQPQIEGVAVRSAKPDVYPDVESVGCCMAWGVGQIADLAMSRQ